MANPSFSELKTLASSQSAFDKGLLSTLNYSLYISIKLSDKVPHELHNKRQKYGWSAFLVPKTLTGCYYLCNTKLYIAFRSDWCPMKRWYKQRRNTWLLLCFLLNKENFTIRMKLCCKLGYLNQQEHHHVILDTATWQIICVWT